MEINAIRPYSFTSNANLDNKATQPADSGKKITKKQAAVAGGLAAAAASVATVIVLAKRGKVAVEGENLLQSVVTGFRTLTTKEGRNLYKVAKEYNKASDIVQSVISGKEVSAKKLDKFITGRLMRTHQGLQGDKLAKAKESIYAQINTDGKLDTEKLLNNYFEKLNTRIIDGYDRALDAFQAIL